GAGVQRSGDQGADVADGDRHFALEGSVEQRAQPDQRGFAASVPRSQEGRHGGGGGAAGSGGGARATFGGSGADAGGTAYAAPGGRGAGSGERQVDRVLRRAVRGGEGAVERAAADGRTGAGDRGDAVGRKGGTDDGPRLAGGSACPTRGLTGSKNQCGAGWQPARRLVTAAGPPRRRQGPIANRPQVTNLPHKISSANRRPLSFSWDFAGRRPIQTDHIRRWPVPPEGSSPAPRYTKSDACIIDSSAGACPGTDSPRHDPGGNCHTR